MNDKIKDLLATAYKTDSIEKNKWRIKNREQLREQRKKELKELMEKEKTMSNNKQSSVDAYCNSCDAFICDELITFEETCSNCGTQIEYFENNNEQ